MNYKHDKDLVISKGMELFWHKGFHNLGVDEICKVTGMTKGAFYNAFKSKERFLLVTLEAYGSLIESHLKKELSKGRSKAFNKLTRLYKDMLESQPQKGFAGCFVNNMMSEMGTLKPNISKMSADQFDRFINVIVPIVQRAQADGDLSDEIPARQLTEIIHTTFYGFLTRTKSLKDTNYKLMILFLKSLKT